MEGVVSDAAVKPASRAEEGRKRVLVTGVEGYIGCLMASRLLDAGYDVDGVDVGFYKTGWLFHDGRDRPRTYCKDIRSMTVADFEGYDAVVHLAELSNDPLCEFNEGITLDVNFRGSANVAEKAKAAGVPRFVYASSCSVYGVGGNEVKNEASAVNPQTAYARCKVLMEQKLSELADKSFSPTALRNATAFGASPRMRFDIVLNNLAGLAWTTNCIKMTSDGTPWRPLVHISDICDSVIAVLEAPREAVFNEVFNVGDDGQNYRVREIVDVVGQVFTGCSIETGKNNGDNRSYQVSFEKIHKHLPGFKCRYSALRGAQELHDIFERIGMTEEVFKAPPFTRLEQLKRLLATRQIDEYLHWRQ